MLCQFFSYALLPYNIRKKESYLNVLNKLGNKFIIGGDYNAKNTLWGSRLTTTKAKELHETAAELACPPTGLWT
jgi:hypothetical protein